MRAYLKRHSRHVTDAQTQASFGRKALLNEKVRRLQNSKRFYFRQVKRLRDEVDYLQGQNQLNAQKHRRNKSLIKVAPNQSLKDDFDKAKTNEVEILAKTSHIEQINQKIRRRHQDSAAKLRQYRELVGDSRKRDEEVRRFLAAAKSRFNSILIFFIQLKEVLASAA